MQNISLVNSIINFDFDLVYDIFFFVNLSLKNTNDLLDDVFFSFITMMSLDAHRRFELMIILAWIYLAAVSIMMMLI